MTQCDCKYCELHRKLKDKVENFGLREKCEEYTVNKALNDMFCWAEAAEMDLDWVEVQIDEGASFDEVKRLVKKANRSTNHWTDEEYKAIQELMAQKDLTYFQVLRQGLRAYQMMESVYTGGLKKYMPYTPPCEE